MTSPFTAEQEEYLQLIKKQAVEEALRILPGVTQNLIAQISWLRGHTEQFYKDNPDLVPYKAQVGKAIEQYEAKHPSAKFEEILPKIADDVRRAIPRLSLDKQVPTKPTLDRLDHLAGML